MQSDWGFDQREKENRTFNIRPAERGQIALKPKQKGCEGDVAGSPSSLTEKEEGGSREVTVHTCLL